LENERGEPARAEELSAHREQAFPIFERGEHTGAMPGRSCAQGRTVIVERENLMASNRCRAG
jgi:hypothetical protein